MRVLFLTRSYYPNIGGVEKHIFQISKLLSLKHKIIIITENINKNVPNHEVLPETIIYRFYVTNNIKLSIWTWLFKNISLLKNSDIIHIHDVFFWIIPFLPFFINKSIYITFHGYEGSDPPKLKQIMWHKIAEIFTKGNICIGDFHKKWYRVNPTKVSYGGVNIHKNISKVSYKKDAIYIGRLHSDTGIMDYLSALRKKRFRLDVYGDGPLMKKAKAYVKKYRLPVRFRGFNVNAPNLLVNYKIAFVSRYLSILEALNAGIPVIAHYNNQIKYDYLSMSPFSKYINICSNANEIVDSINNYNKNKIKPGQKWAREQTWEKVARQYEQLWGLR